MTHLYIKVLDNFLVFYVFSFVLFHRSTSTYISTSCRLPKKVYFQINDIFDQIDQHLRCLPGPVGVLGAEAGGPVGVLGAEAGGPVGVPGAEADLELLDEPVEAPEDVAEVPHQDSGNKGMFN